MGYGPKWHNLTNSGCQISILRVCGPKWYLGTSSRAAGVFSSFLKKEEGMNRLRFNNGYIIREIVSTQKNQRDSTDRICIIAYVNTNQR